MFNITVLNRNSIYLKILVFYECTITPVACTLVHLCQKLCTKKASKMFCLKAANKILVKLIPGCNGVAPVSSIVNNLDSLANKPIICSLGVTETISSETCLQLHCILYEPWCFVIKISFSKTQHNAVKQT